jgi:long-subunit fatty acid transport protein
MTSQRRARSCPRRATALVEKPAAGAALALALMTSAGGAAASSGLDSPESGVVQSGRGSAWLARADDPLAVYFNPAALAFQSNGVHLGAQLMFMKRCFTRKGDGGVPVSPGNDLPGPGARADPDRPMQVAPPAEVCSDPGAFPNPQVAATFRLANRFALGVALVAPHASGNNNWPLTLPYTNRFGIKLQQPAPNRYMLVSSDATIAFPTVSVGFAPTETLAFGAGFIWGIATANFVNFSELLSPNGSATGVSDQFEKNLDVRSELTAKDLFIPGFVLSALWSPSSNLDLAAWFKWTDAVRSNSADLHLTTFYWNTNGTVKTDTCKDKARNCNIVDRPGVGSLKLSLPMEAKLAVRYHMARAGAPRPALNFDGTPVRRVRDPLSEDLFDIELDFTWANNSSVDNIEIRFPTGSKRIPVKDTEGNLIGSIPENADVPHKWKDVLGVRLGGDVTILPSRLALRAGGFVESKGQDDKYLGLDFDVAEKIGVSGGATVRVGPVDVSASYQHTFFGTIDNGGKGAVRALSGQEEAKFRSQQTINGGTLKASLNEVGLSGTARF